MQKKDKLIRIAEHNDWVIFTLLGCIISLSLMLISLQREASIKEYLSQSFEDSSNIFLSWFIVSVVYIVSISVLISQFIPIVPSFLRKISIFGLQLNKFGFTFVSISLFYLIKTTLSYFYFYAVRNNKSWQKFYFTATRFYFVLAILIILGCLQQFYFPIKRLEIFQLYLLFFTIIFVFKNIFYLFHNYKILPQTWYYKILYICTLQIIPLLVLWKFLFY